MFTFQWLFFWFFQLHVHCVAGMTDLFVFVCMDMGISVSTDVTCKILSKQGTSLLVTSNPLSPGGISITTPDHTMPIYKCLNGSEIASDTMYIVKAISSTQPSASVMFMRSDQAGESHALLKISDLGLSYYAVTYCEVRGKCQISIASYKDQEVSVNITLPSDDESISITLDNVRYNQGATIHKTLRKFDALQLQCDCDLTGTKIISQSPVAVFSGATETIVGMKGSKSFHIEQMPSLLDYGKEYAYSCLSCGEQGAFIRILAKNSPTRVTMTGYKTVEIKAGKFIHRRVEKNRSVYIRANKGVLVVVFTLNGNNNSGDYSSSMHVLQPIDFSAEHYSITIPAGGTNAAVAFIGPLGTTYKKNGAAFTETPLISESIPGSILGAIQYRITESTPLIFSSDGDSFVMYMMYTSDSNVIHSISPVTYLDKKTSPWLTPPSYDGDGVGLDDVDCINDHSPVSRSRKDCRKYTSGESDTEGRDFQLVFPIFDDEPKSLSLKVTGSSSQFQGNCDSDTVLPSGISDIDISLCFTVNTSGYYPMKAMNLNTHSVSVDSTEVSVAVTIEGQTVSTSYLAYPTDTLGLEHYAITYCKDDFKCGCTVTTILPNTVVYVILLSDTSITINGQTYTSNKPLKQVFKNTRSVLMFTSTKDLTGTLIKGNAPISVLCGGRSKSSLFLEQMLPVEKASDKYMVYDKYSDITYRVVAPFSNTIVTAKSTFTNRYILRQAGDHVDVSIGSTRSITASNVVYVVAIVNGILGETLFGDMWNLVPETGTKTEYKFGKPGNYKSTSLVIVGGTTGSSVTVADTDSNKEISGNITSLVTLIDHPGHSTTKIHMSDNLPFALYVRSSISTHPQFVLQVGRNFPDHNDMCTISANMQVSDNIDNDCDGLIDEDICVKDLYRQAGHEYLTNRKYIPDFDIDGILDEDCSTYCTIPSSTLESSYIESTTEQFSSIETTPYLVSTAVTDSKEASSILIDDTSSMTSVDMSTGTGDTYIAPSSSEQYSVTSDILPSTMSTNAVNNISPTASSIFSTPTASRAPCKCPCKRTPSPKLNNITREELIEIMAETKKELTVEKSTLTMFKLKKVSAKDNRPSAITFGAFGLIFIVFAIGIIIAGDLMSLQEYLDAAKNFGLAFNK